jgi:DNA repair exonuclease SbcCD ATPase subunit
LAALFDPNAALPPPVASRPLALEAITALARELGKLISSMRPIDGYEPEPLLAEPPLSPSLARAIGAPTLADYFTLTLKSLGLPPERTVRALALPRGPESLESALHAVEETLIGYEAADESSPGRYRRIKAELLTIQTALVKAQKIFPAFQEMATGFAQEAHAKYRVALKTKEAMEAILSKDKDRDLGGESPDALALTAYTSTLRESLAEALHAQAARDGWSLELGEFHEELENLLAILSQKDKSELKALTKNLKDRKNGFMKRHEELSLRRLESERKLKGALNALIAAERRFSGDGKISFRDEAEQLASTSGALLKATLKSRENLAEFWRLSPSLIGRPVFLEKIFLSSAVNLGLAQGILEEIGHRLEAFTKSLSPTRLVRQKAEEFLSSRSGVRESQGLLHKAEKLLATLISAADGIGKGQELQDELGALKEEKDKALLLANLKEGEKKALEEDFDQRISQLEAQHLGELGEVSRRLKAVTAEKERLVQDLKGAQRKLAANAEAKSGLIKIIARARKALEEQLEEKKAVQKDILEAKGELDALRRRHKRLAELFAAGRQKLSALEEDYGEKSREAEFKVEELRAHEEEKAKLTLKLDELSAELKSLTGDRQALADRTRELTERLEEIRARESALGMRLAGKEEELKEINRNRVQLGEVVSAFKLHLDRVNRAYNALKASWRRRGNMLQVANMERDNLRLKLDRKKEELIEGATKLQDLKTELSQAQSRREELEAEQQELIEGIQEARQEAKSSKENEERLKTELMGLQSEEGDLTPIVRILGIALYQCGLALGEQKDLLSAALDDQSLVYGAREAGVRIQGATRELEYIDLLETTNQELNSVRAEKMELTQELEHLKEFSETKSQDDESSQGSSLTHHLAIALVVALQRREKLAQRVKDFKNKTQEKLDEAQSTKSQLEAISQTKDKALAEFRERVTELTSLIRFFLEEGRRLWVGSDKGDASEALTYLMLEENNKLSEEVNSLKASLQDSRAESGHLLALTKDMQERLITLRPLLEFLINKFQENSLALAKAYASRDEMAADLARLKEGATAPLEVTLQSGADEETLRQLDSLKGEKARLSLENESLSNTAKRQAEELAAKGADAKKLYQENQALILKIAQRDAKIEKLDQDIEEIKENPPPDGRVETAWAAFNYLGAKAGDALNRLEAQLANQAREIEEAFRELQKRDARIKTLESRQDRLALLYWTMLSLASNGLSLRLPAGTGTNDEGGQGGNNSPGGQGTPPGTMAPPGAPPLGGGEGSFGAKGDPSSQGSTHAQGGPKGPAEVLRDSGLLSLAFLKSLKDAARKGLFTLILTGSVALGATSEATADKITDGPLFGSFSPYHGEGAQPGQARFAYKEGTFLAYISTKIHSRVLGRTLDLGFLPPLERDMDQRAIEQKAKEILRLQAQARGLGLEEWISLVRNAFDEGTTIYLPELESALSYGKLISPQLPSLAKGLEGSAISEELWNLALSGAARLKGGEGLFWERVYNDFMGRMGDPSEASKAAVLHLARKNRVNLPRIEYVGVLSPIKELEDMGEARVQEFLSNHIKNYWTGGYRRLPRKKEKLAYLALDLYSASRIFRVPLTLLAALSHQHYESSGNWPEALDVYSGSLKVASLVARLSRPWNLNSPHICDLDELAVNFAISKKAPMALWSKRQTLLNSVTGEGRLRSLL